MPPLAASSTPPACLTTAAVGARPRPARARAGAEGRRRRGTCTPPREPLPLDFFVLFSSAASVLPSPGQGNYAAANAFPRRARADRRALGLPGLEHQLGSVGRVGMAAGLAEREQQRWARHGVQFISPDDGVAAFVRAAARARAPRRSRRGRRLAQVRRRASRGGIAAARRSRRGRTAPRRAPRQPAAAGARPRWSRNSPRAPRNRRRDTVLDTRRASRSSGARAGGAFTLDRISGLRDVGMDSLMAVELRNRLQRSVGTHAAGDARVRPPDGRGADASHIARRRARRSVPRRPAGRARAGRVSGDCHARLGCRRRTASPIVGIGCRFPGGADDPDELLAAAARRRRRDQRGAARIAGTSTRTTIPTRTRPARCTRAAAASSTRRPVRSARSSASRRARRSAWIRSSGCCSRWRGRRSSTPASRPTGCSARATGVFVGIST